MSETTIRRLAAAVLELAVKDYKLGVGGAYEDSKKWFNEKSRNPFGFYWCLRQIGMNPSLVKKHLDKLDEKHSHRPVLA